jgi:uncharacterized sulfatase
VKYRLFFAFLTLLLATVASLGAGAGRPNFVVFIADDLGGLDTTPYGSQEVRTPNLERLAARGLKFTHAHVASPSCAPSRAALLTGLMPARNGAEPNHTRPREEIKKLPAYLQELGYEVASFGKVAHYNHGAYYKFDHVAGEGGRNYTGVGLATEWLAQRKGDKPLCLFVGTNWPHVPWPHETPGYEPAKVALPPKFIDTPETRLWRTRYYAAVTKADDDLGRVLDAMGKHLDAKNTFVFFTSDHGGQWPFGKWNLYDSGTRVPLIAAGPGIKPGAATDALVSWIDLLPTLVDLAGGKPPAEIDGRSFAGVLLGKSDRHRDEVYTTHSGDNQFNVYPIRAVTDGRWKYILNLHPEYQHATHINRAASGDGLSYWNSWEAAARSDKRAEAIVQAYKQRPREELYDLAADPHEQTNLAAESEYAQRLAALRERLATWMKSQGDTGRVFNEPLLLGAQATPIHPPGKAKAARP